MTIPYIDFASKISGNSVNLLFLTENVSTSASPQNTSLTIAAGSRRRAVRVEPLSRQISRYSAYYDDYIGDVDRKQIEMTQKKLDLRLDDLKLRKLTAAE